MAYACMLAYVVLYDAMMMVLSMSIPLTHVRPDNTDCYIDRTVF